MTTDNTENTRLFRNTNKTVFLPSLMISSYFICSLNQSKCKGKYKYKTSISVLGKRVHGRSIGLSERFQHKLQDTNTSNFFVQQNVTGHVAQLVEQRVA